MPDKAALRRAALTRRDGLSDTDRQAAAAFLVENRGAFDSRDGNAVSGFWPIRGEIDPIPVMQTLSMEGRSLCLPVIMDRTTIVFRAWDGTDQGLVDTGFGTRGPGPDTPQVDPDIMLVPIAAFDRQGGRIGYGAGYYDRAIARLDKLGRPPRLVGLAFSCQEVDAVPVEPHDRALHLIVTEREIISCSPS